MSKKRQSIRGSSKSLRCNPKSLASLIYLSRHPLSPSRQQTKRNFRIGDQIRSSMKRVLSSLTTLCPSRVIVTTILLSYPILLRNLKSLMESAWQHQVPTFLQITFSEQPQALTLQVDLNSEEAKSQTALTLLQTRFITKDTRSSTTSDHRHVNLNTRL